MEDLLSIVNNKGIDKTIIDFETKEKYIPQVKKTVTYIVAGLIFNEKDEVLLMQEAKKSCKGLWYLPAGRMEANETIEDAVMREVTEETGMICHLDCIISVHMSSHKWFRFNTLCSVRGGILKTKPDAESLKAMWFKVTDVLDGHKVQLRSQDILSVIKDAYYFHKNQNKLLKITPINLRHHQLLMRLVTIFYDKTKNEHHVLIGSLPTVHLPVIDVTSGPLLYKVFLKKILVECHFDMKSVLTLEHCGKPKHANDGFCISVLIHASGDQLPGVLDFNQYHWIEITDLIVHEFVAKITSELEGPRVVF